MVKEGSMPDEPEDQDAMDGELRALADRISPLSFDRERGRELAERGGPELSIVEGSKDAQTETRFEIGWRKVAGTEPVEGRHTWIDLPHEILVALGGKVEKNFSISPEGSPDTFNGAAVTLGVFGVLHGRLVIIDSTGAEIPMEDNEGVLFGLVPTVCLSRTTSANDLPAFEGVIRFRWYER